MSRSTLEPSHNSVIHSCLLLVSNSDLRDKAKKSRTPSFFFLGARLPIPVNSMTPDRKIVSRVIALDKLWLKPFIVKPYWLGHDLSLCSAYHHSCFFGPWIGHQSRGPHFLFVFLLGLIAFLEHCLFSCLECVLEVIATRTTLDRNSME